MVYYHEVKSLANENVLILGMGTSGYAAADLALRYGASVTALDFNSNIELEGRAKRLLNRGAKVYLDFNKESWNDPVDLVITSPGLFPTSPLIQMASKLGCPVISELEFGFNYCSCPILAVTGTNGKTTTVEMVIHCLKGIGRKVLGAGNIGRPLSEVARKSASLDYIVVEVSSFQLEAIENFAPLVAAILNVTEDHTDRYESHVNYLETKFRLRTNMQGNKNLIIKYELLQKKEVCSHFSMAEMPPTTFTSSSDSPKSDYHVDTNGYICHNTSRGSIPLLNTAELKLRGRHNIENVEAVLAMCKSIGVSHSEIAPYLKNFVGRGHRQELVTVMNGVKYINDSKSTNPDALVQALTAFGELRENGQGNIILIAGGRNKQMNFGPVIPYIRKYAKEVYLIGELKNHLSDVWSKYAPCRKFASISAVVLSAIENTTPGDIVLFSPGAASLDMFSNYEERGDFFSNEVKRRLEK